MNKVNAALFTIVVLMLAGSAWAGVIAPGLEAQLQPLNGDDEVKVLVVLRDQADIENLSWQLHDNLAPRAERNQAVIGALQDAAYRSQEALTDDLQARRNSGEIRGYTAHWLINAVVVVGTVDAIREIALRDDVEVIEPDLQVELIEPVPNSKEYAAEGQRGIGTTPGIEAIQARRVWEELGIDGTGVVVGNMDSGVDGNHVALGDRWRGHFADPAACWLDNSGQGNPNFPVDNYYHGTHVMGTITGLAPDDTIGVAPGALWIAANTINQNVGPEFDNDVLEALEWFADPDGDPGTTDDVPCVVQNSWRINENFGFDYVDCDSRWWAAIDNCEAAGVVLTWSAGNEGPGSQSVGSPADRATSPYNTFSVGSTLTYEPYEISSFSSRGPAGTNCGPEEYRIKPEICAPGSDIYSSVPGGFGYSSGTSMSGPHVAGVVALMCSANPNLDVITIKQVLMDTALDLGAPGEDNTYGHGFVNAYEAVLAVMGGLGMVSGTITDADTGLPLAGVHVSVVDRPVHRFTDEDGQYQLILPVGEWTLTFDLFAYGDEELTVEIIEDETIDGSVTMTALPTAVLSGLVYEFEGALVEGAIIRVLDTPIEPVYSDASGFYSLEMPPGATYDVVARASGYGADQHTVDFQGDMTLDFVLPELFAEDFETGNFLMYPWEMGGDADWVIDDVNPYEGFYSARSGDVSNSQNSDLEVTVQVIASADISFWYRVSSEANYDYLRFYIDGQEIASWDGTVGWSQYTYPVEAGLRTFKWSYTKDGSDSSGEDAGWVDFIEFPILGEILYPSVTVDPTLIEETVEQGAIGQATITVGNVGEADLQYDFAIQYQGGPVGSPSLPSVPYHELEKGETDPYIGQPPVTGQGGPDGFGYRWIDSDEPGGPVYDWQDISDIGDVVGSGVDSNHGPFPLGFNFSYYGETFDSIRVCTNGWLSFTSTDSTYFNRSIPLTDEPNNLIAPFWDDLNPNDGGTIYYYADADNYRFIVQWDEVPHYAVGSPETFQVVLSVDGSIVYQYHTVAIDDDCTVGIENAAGDDGLQVIYNAGGYLYDGLAIRFAVDPSLNWLSVMPPFGVVEPQMPAEVEVTMNATELELGVYSANLLLTTNDPDNPEVIIPVILTVADAVNVPNGDEPQADLPALVTALSGAHPNPFNPMTTIRFSLGREQQVRLAIFDLSGKQVAELVNGVLPAGEHPVLWNGKDSAGRGVSSGSYMIYLEAEDLVKTAKMTLLR